MRCSVYRIRRIGSRVGRLSAELCNILSLDKISRSHQVKVSSELLFENASGLQESIDSGV